MDGPAIMRQALMELDVDTIRKLWTQVAPHLPQPKGEFEALATMHYARTTMDILPNRARFYSHRWLLDHNQMSGLPDELKPSAERMFPVVTRSVGVSMNGKSDLTRPIIPIVRSAVEVAIMEVYADKKQDDIPLLKRHMNEAKRYAVRKLLGIDNG